MNGVNVLIVDDDQAVRLVANEMLAALGCQVTSVSGGKEALEILDQQGFDLIFLDVGMPVMNGVEVYRIVRKALPQQNIAFITGYAEEDLSEYTDAHTWVVSKPFSLDSLKQVLRQVGD